MKVNMLLLLMLNFLSCTQEKKIINNQISFDKNSDFVLQNAPIKVDNAYELQKVIRKNDSKNIYQDIELKLIDANKGVLYLQIIEQNTVIKFELNNYFENPNTNLFYYKNSDEKIFIYESADYYSSIMDIFLFKNNTLRSVGTVSFYQDNPEKKGYKTFTANFYKDKYNDKLFYKIYLGDKVMHDKEIEISSCKILKRTNFKPL